MTSEHHSIYIRQSPLTVEDPAESYKRIVLDKQPAIRANREYSLEMLSEIRKRVTALEGTLSKNIVCAAVCGSYARLDASAESDLDFIVVTCNGGDNGAFILELTKIATDLNLSAPNSKGVFAEDADKEQLLNRIGARDETYDDLSRRLLLLLESQSLPGKKQYKILVKHIIDHYSKEVETDRCKNFVFFDK